MVLSFALFIGGLYVIIKGGDFLVTAALGFNKISGINQVIIGATVVSVATTLPEVFVSVFAVVSDNHGIAIGNAVGAMIANVALVLALYITFMPNKVNRRSIYGKSLYLFVVTGLVFLFATNLKITWFEGIMLLVFFSFFLYLNINEAKNDEGTLRYDRNAANDKAFLPKDIDNAVTTGIRTGAVRKVVIGFIVGQVMLVIGAFLLVDHGERLAHMFGISETVVGLTAIAVGTSMPELVTCITSIRKKSGGLALGNVLGSNIINCTLLIGVCGLIGDIHGAALPLSRDTFLVSLPFLFVLYLIAIVPMMLKARTYRWQGVALLSLYAVYVGYLIIIQPG